MADIFNPSAGGGGGGNGTVTSVAFSGDGVIFNSTVSGSPITTTGTLSPTLLTETANTVLAGPTTAPAATPTFRSLVGNDMPLPASGSLGGVESIAQQTSNWINSISTSGVPSLSQPVFSDISGSVASTQMPAFSGAITTSAGSTVASIATNLALPGNPTTTTQSIIDSSTKIATTSFVQTAISTFASGHPNLASCDYATTIALPSNVYNNGSSGVGATLTGVALAALTVDGSSPSVGQSILVKNEAAPANNGIYTVTATGSVAAVYVLTRRTDYNMSSEIVAGNTVFVTSGSTLNMTTWTMITPGTITVGTTAITFTQTAGPGSYIAGAGLTLTGSTFSISSAGVTNAMLAGSITASNLVGTDIATIGTITTGTWNGTVITGQYGGTGVANTGKTITLGGNLVTSGAFGTTLTVTNTTNVTLPTSGTLMANTLASADIFVGNGSNVATAVSVSGDATLSNTGAFTVTKTSGTAFAASATTNALNASNISSGTLNGARLPLSTVNAWTAQQYVVAAALTPGATVAWNANSSNVTLAPTQNFTLSNPTNIHAGGSYIITITQDATGSRVITWGSAYKFPSGAKYVLSTAPSAVDTICMYSPDGVNLHCVGNPFS